jgi:hypothetical protein
LAAYVEGETSQGSLYSHSPPNPCSIPKTDYPSKFARHVNPVALFASCWCAHLARSCAERDEDVTPVPPLLPTSADPRRPWQNSPRRHAPYFPLMLIRNGALIVYVREEMGHSSIQVTIDIDGHLIPGANLSFVDVPDMVLEQEDKATSQQSAIPELTGRSSHR